MRRTEHMVHLCKRGENTKLVLGLGLKELLVKVTPPKANMKPDKRPPLQKQKHIYIQTMNVRGSMLVFGGVRQFDDGLWFFSWLILCKPSLTLFQATIFSVISWCTKPKSHCWALVQNHITFAGGSNASYGRYSCSGPLRSTGQCLQSCHVNAYCTVAISKERGTLHKCNLSAETMRPWFQSLRASLFKKNHLHDKSALIRPARRSFVHDLYI